MKTHETINDLLLDFIIVTEIQRNKKPMKIGNFIKKFLLNNKLKNYE